MTPLASRDKEYSINLEISKIHVIIDSDKCYGKDDLKRKKKIWEKGTGGGRNSKFRLLIQKHP